MICFRITTQPFFQGFPRISQLKTKGFPEKSFQSSTPTKELFKAAIKKKNFCQIPCHHAWPSLGTLLLTVDATHVFKRRYLGVCAKRNIKKKKRQNVYCSKQTKGKISPNMRILSKLKELGCGVIKLVFDLKSFNSWKLVKKIYCKITDFQVHFSQ